MDQTLIFGAIVFGALLLAFLIRYGIRSYFREKDDRLARLMDMPQADYEPSNEKEK